MKVIETTAFDQAQRFVGVTEIPGTVNNPLVMAMLKLDNAWPQSDEVSWCSAFVNFVCWWLRLPRSKSLAARSWLQIGKPVPLASATVGFDVVVLNRGGSPNPDTAGPGHVGFYAGVEGNHVLLLGGNQSDKVSIARFPTKDILGIRTLI